MKLSPFVLLLSAAVVTLLTIDIYRALKQNVDRGEQLELQTHQLAQMEQTLRETKLQMEGIYGLLNQQPKHTEGIKQPPNEQLKEGNATQENKNTEYVVAQSHLVQEATWARQSIQNLNDELDSLRDKNHFLQQAVTQLKNNSSQLLANRNEAYQALNKILGLKPQAIASSEDLKIQLSHQSNSHLEKRLRQLYCSDVTRRYLQEVNKVSACQWGNLQSLLSENAPDEEQKQPSEQKSATGNTDKLKHPSPSSENVQEFKKELSPIGA